MIAGAWAAIDATAAGVAEASFRAPASAARTIAPKIAPT